MNGKAFSRNPLGCEFDQEGLRLTDRPVCRDIAPRFLWRRRTPAVEEALLSWIAKRTEVSATFEAKPQMWNK